MFTRIVTLANRQRVFQEETEGYFLDFVPRGPRLVVVFEAAGAVLDRPDGDRLGWGHDWIINQGHSMISVKPKKVEWYRGADLHRLFRDPEFIAFCTKYERVLFYGGSMGGYAALALAQAIPGAYVLAHGPQSTLAADLVPWERRFLEGRLADWSGDFRDGADTPKTAGKIYITYDPFHKYDTWHAKRIQGPNVFHLRSPFAGHVPQVFLTKLGVFKDVFIHAMAGDERFYAGLIRDRRRLGDYLATMGGRARNPELKQNLYTRALELDPGNIPALHDLILARSKAGDHEIVADYYARVAHLKGINQSYLLPIKVYSGLSLLALGRDDEARQVVDDVWQTKSESPDLFRQLLKLCRGLADKGMDMGEITTHTEARITYLASIRGGVVAEKMLG